jgi:hypothetical protein
MILLGHERVFLSHQTIGTTPTACIRFAALSRIEILHILLEHLYDSQRNENARSARRLHRRQPVSTVVSVGFSPGRTLVAGGWDSSCGCGAGAAERNRDQLPAARAFPTSWPPT